jgi:hypothetical protein
MLHFSGVMNMRSSFSPHDAGQNERKENDPDDRANDFEFHAPPPETFCVGREVSGGGSNGKHLNAQTICCSAQDRFHWELRH